MTTDTNKQAALLPCPFCGAGETQIVENGKVWSGMKYSEPTSVSVRHWCQKVEGQPSRMLERIGKDHASAIAAWNQRAAPQGEAVDWQGLTDAEIDDLCPDVWSDWKTHARAIEAKLREKNTAHQPAAGVEVAKPGQCWPESVMQQWDYWRKQIADGDSSSAPRDWFESLAPEPAQPEPQGERATPTESQIEAAGAAFDEYFNSHPFDELTSGKAVAREMLTAALLSAAPAVREPLTEEQAEEGRRKWLYGPVGHQSAFIAGVRYAEAAHGIGKPKQVGINGLTEAETAASASVMGIVNRPKGAESCCEHASDCAVHNAPAYPPGPCDCGADQCRVNPQYSGPRQCSRGTVGCTKQHNDA